MEIMLLIPTPTTFICDQNRFIERDFERAAYVIQIGME